MRSSSSSTVISTATCHVLPQAGVLNQHSAANKMPDIKLIKPSDICASTQPQSKTASSTMAQMDQVISEASIAQMQTATVLIEKQYASEDAQLIQDAQVVFNQIEQNRKMQHLLTEKRKNELLMAVYNDFLQWVHQMTSEDMKMKLNRSESSLSTTTTKDTTFQNEQNPTTSSPNSVSIKVQDRADNDEHSEVSDTGSRSNGSIRSMEPMETEEDEDE